MENLHIPVELPIDQEPAMYFKLLRKMLDYLHLDMGTTVSGLPFKLSELVAVTKKTYPEGDQIVLITNFIAKWSEVIVDNNEINYEFNDRAEEALLFMQDELN